MEFTKKGEGKILFSDPQRQELDAIKARQKARKEAGVPAQVTNKELYQMLSDILENQAKIENRLMKIMPQR